MRMRWLLLLAAAAAAAPCTRNATRFTLYGERHSGTNLLQHLVEQNFRVDVRFQWGWKHFWLANASEPRAPEPDADVAVAVSLREVSAWLASMHRKPHHSPRPRGQGIGAWLMHGPWISYSSPNHNKWPVDPAATRVETASDVLALRAAKLKAFAGLAGRPRTAFFRYEDVQYDQAGTLRRLAAELCLPLREGARGVDRRKDGPGLALRAQRLAPVRPGALIARSECDLDARLGGPAREFYCRGVDRDLERRAGYPAAGLRGCYRAWGLPEPPNPCAKKKPRPPARMGRNLRVAFYDLHDPIARVLLAPRAGVLSFIPRRYVLIINQRAGGTWITETLNSHAQLHIAGEFVTFKPAEHRVPHIERFFASAEECNETRYRACGLRIPYKPFVESEVMRWLERHAERVGAILVTRWNKLSHLVSHTSTREIQKATGDIGKAYHCRDHRACAAHGVEVTIETPTLLKQMREMVDADTQMRALLNHSKLRWREFVYEDLMTGGFASMIDFLGADPSSRVKSTLVKRITRPLAETIENFGDVEQIIGSRLPYRCFLELDVSETNATSECVALRHAANRTHQVGEVRSSARRRRSGARKKGHRRRRRPTRRGQRRRAPASGPRPRSSAARARWRAAG